MTLAMLPLVCETVAVRVRSEPALKVLPLAGLVIVTTGCRFEVSVEVVVLIVVEVEGVVPPDPVELVLIELVLVKALLVEVVLVETVVVEGFVTVIATGL